jgi:hypothetical protein
MKIIIFDIDETIGYFSQIYVLCHAVEKEFGKRMTIYQFTIILNMFPEVFRPDIFNLFKYLSLNKDALFGFYTNTHLSKAWLDYLIIYIHNNIGYKLFDFLIAPNSIYRTTKKKKFNDLECCVDNIINKYESRAYCFIDDVIHAEMCNPNLTYIIVSPYVNEMGYNDIMLRFKLNMHKLHLQNIYMEESFFNQHAKLSKHRSNQTKLQFNKNIILKITDFINYNV